MRLMPPLDRETIGDLPQADAPSWLILLHWLPLQDPCSPDYRDQDLNRHSIGHPRNGTFFAYEKELGKAPADQQIVV